MRSVEPGYTLSGIRAFLKEMLEALWYTVDGTEMVDMFGGEPCTLSEDAGMDYIPADYEGTITAPDVDALKTADADNVLYDGGGTAIALSVADLIDEDIPRIPVKYDEAAPHHIRMFGIIKPEVYADISDEQKFKISNYMDLWAFYWGEFNGAGSIWKENRTL